MKIIVWGLPLHSHTHSYIHHAFARASMAMGYETCWVENSEKSNELVRHDDIVISCGVADSFLLYKKGVNYVLHNSDRDDLRDGSHLNLQVYTTDVLNRETENLGDLTFWQSSNRTLYQPWATDLLPNEIASVTPVNASNQSNEVIWIGSIMGGEQGNYEEISRYASLCDMKGNVFKVARGTSIEGNIEAIRMSRHSPAIQGKWQVEKGYVPCRIFKNISYGRMSLTNSRTVADLLELDFCKDIDELYEKSESVALGCESSITRSKMKLVSDKHTYINRLEKIMRFVRS